MDISQDTVLQFLALFNGFKEAYGTYVVERTALGGKKEGKATTLRRPVTVSLYEKHLNGETSLGIIPIDQDNEVYFGAIDIDNYNNFSLTELAKIVETVQAPLVVCRSKSGGAHVYYFSSNPVPASMVQNELKNIAAQIGHAKNESGRSVEIFPKQSMIAYERNDLGSWINLPYFDHEHTERYAIDGNGRELSLQEFIAFANQKIDKYEATFTEESFVEKEEAFEKELEGAPPCLQILCQKRVQHGSRNNFLLSLGIFAKKKFSNWQEKLEKWNREFISDPLSSQEVIATVKSINKKDYNYPCDKDPICSFCNSQLCRTRKYGVGGDSALPELSSLRKLLTTPATFFWSGVHNGKSFVMELTASDLQNARNFQKKCIEVLNLFPNIPKADVWAGIVQEALDNVIEIEMPVDATSEGQFIELLHQFINDRGTDEKEALLNGRPVISDGRAAFRLLDLQAYLKSKGFNELSTQKIATILKENKKLDSTHLCKRIGEATVNVWEVASIFSITTYEPKALNETEIPY